MLLFLYDGHCEQCCGLPKNPVETAIFEGPVATASLQKGNVNWALRTNRNDMTNASLLSLDLSIAV
jgi:hypothetical protein